MGRVSFPGQARTIMRQVLDICRAFDHRVRLKKFFVDLQSDAWCFERPGAAFAVDTERRLISQGVTEQIVFDTSASK